MGDRNERVSKRLKTVEADSARQQDTSQSEQKVDEADIYEHVKEGCDSYDTQTYGKIKLFKFPNYCFPSIWSLRSAGETLILCTGGRELQTIALIIIKMPILDAATTEQQKVGGASQEEQDEESESIQMETIQEEELECVDVQELKPEKERSSTTTASGN